MLEALMASWPFQAEAVLPMVSRHCLANPARVAVSSAVEAAAVGVGPRVPEFQGFFPVAPQWSPAGTGEGSSKPPTPQSATVFGALP